MGYNQYRKSFSAKTRVSASGLRVKMQTAPTVMRAYPIIADGVDVCLSGARVQGTNPGDLGWRETYKVSNGAGFVFGVDKASDRFCVENVRIDNAWDGIRASKYAKNFCIRGVYITYNRDDAIENDWRNAGRVLDSLFDGTFVFYSSSSSIGNTSNEVLFDKVLVYMQPLPKPPDYESKPGFRVAFKLDANSPKMRIKNSIFLIPQKASIPGGDPFRTLKEKSYKLIESSNNKIVWTGGGNYPFTPPPGFSVTTDRSVYDFAKNNWLNRYPKVR
jgi:hypothetical protein